MTMRHQRGIVTGQELSLGAQISSQLFAAPIRCGRVTDRGTGQN